MKYIRMYMYMYMQHMYIYTCICICTHVHVHACVHQCTGSLLSFFFCSVPSPFINQ